MDQAPFSTVIVEGHAGADPGIEKKGGGGGETMGKKLALPMPMRARGPSMQNNAWEIVWESKKCVSAHKKSRRKI